MEQESSPSDLPSFIENLINSRNRDASLLLPFFLGLNAATPLQETENHGGPPDRIVLINPFTQEMVVFERSSSESSNSSFAGFDSLFNDLFSGKDGRPPASKASIDAMESVEIEGGENENENDGDQCIICLEEWEIGERAKRMPCKHRFHEGCIVKWLKIHGSCPVCRYEMPMDEIDDEKKSGGDGERRREIWVSFTFSRGSRSGESDQDVSSGGSDSLTSDQELQN